MFAYLPLIIQDSAGLWDVLATVVCPPTILSLTRNMDYLDKSSFTPFLTSGTKKRKKAFFFFFNSRRKWDQGQNSVSALLDTTERLPQFYQQSVKCCMGKLHNRKKVYFSLFWILFRNHQEVTKSQQNCGQIYLRWNKEWPALEMGCAGVGKAVSSQRCLGQEMLMGGHTAWGNAERWQKIVAGQ